MGISRFQDRFNQLTGYFPWSIPYRIRGESMVPAFRGGQYVLAIPLKRSRQPLRRGDVVVFRRPAGEPGLDLKRIIGLPEEYIFLEGGQVHINDQPLPETPVARGAQELPKILAGQWAAWRGSIYFHADRFAAPGEQQFAFASEGVGLTLSEVHDVQIVGLSFRHFRLDGISVHSRCRNVVLEKVQSLGNGRAGLFVGGTSAVHAIECRFTNNRRHNILIRGRHAVASVDPKLAAPPTFID